MPRSYGTVTDSNQGKGDPNILKVPVDGDLRIRLLEDQAAAWVQHTVRNPQDDDKYEFVTCPGRSCPLCRKPTGPNGKQYFARSRRFAANVWDYGTNSVKILVLGPQVFEEFDKAARRGLDPKASDWSIEKTGKGEKTKYSATRHDASPFEHDVQPSDLHDLAKFEQADSVTAIFEALERQGIDYDSLPLPSFTLEEAQAFVMPYGKFKNDTLERIVANGEVDYLEYLHGAMASEGRIGSEVFVAIQVVLEDLGKAEPLDQAPAPVATPTPQPTPTPAPVPTAAIRLVPPGGGDVIEVADEATAAAMEAAGFTREQAQPMPERQPRKDESGNFILIKDGTQVAVPEAAVAAMLGSGYEHVYDEPAEQPRSAPEPVMVPKVNVDGTHALRGTDGAEVAVPEAAVEPMLAAGFERIMVKEQAEAQAAPAAADPPTASDSLDPALTRETPDGSFEHPALPGKTYKAKGGVTQALNRLRKQEEPEPASDPEPAAASNGNGSGSTDRDAVLERVKDQLSKSPVARDYSQLLDLFQRVANKKNVAEFTVDELLKLEAELANG